MSSFLVNLPVYSLQLTTLLKTNYFTGIRQGFCQFLGTAILRNTYKQLPLHFFLVILLLTLNTFLLAWYWFLFAGFIICKKKLVSINIYLTLYVIC